MHGVLLTFAPSKSWWCSRIARRFPGLAIQLLNAVPTASGICIETADLHGAATAEAIAWLKQRHPRRVMVIEEGRGRAEVRFSEDDSPIRDLIVETGIVPWFPFQFIDGECRWLVMGDHGEAVGVFRRLASLGIEARTLRAGEWEPVQSALTDHQKDTFDAAVQSGYYDFPRRLTLTALASRVGVAKSTLSETLMAVEHKIMHGHRGAATTQQMVPSHRRSPAGKEAGSAAPQ